VSSSLIEAGKGFEGDFGTSSRRGVEK